MLWQNCIYTEDSEHCSTRCWLLQVTEALEQRSCLPGSFWDNVRCAACPEQYYQPARGRNFCFACPEDRTTLSTGSYTPQQCREYGRGRQHPKIGKSKNEIQFFGGRKSMSMSFGKKFVTL